MGSSKLGNVANAVLLIVIVTSQRVESFLMRPPTVHLDIFSSFKYRPNEVHQLQLRRKRGLDSEDPLAQMSKITKNKFGGDVQITHPSENTITDLPLYATLGIVQLLPPLSILTDATADSPELVGRKFVAYVYFAMTATLSVYLGSRRSDLRVFEGESLIGTKNALAAPLLSSVILFIFYYILKFTNYEQIFGFTYQVLALLIGGLSIDTVISLTYTYGRELTEDQIKDRYIEDMSTSDTGVLLAAITILGYVFSSMVARNGDLNSLYLTSFFNNIIAVSIALQAISLVRVKNFGEYIVIPF